jgi:hypothetical protein
MNRLMMDPAQRHDIFVTDLAAKRPRLHEAQAPGIRVVSSAHDAALFGDELQMFLAMMPMRFGDCRGVIVCKNMEAFPLFR